MSINQEEQNLIIEKELKELAPKNLTQKEKNIWRMCFNALRLSDLTNNDPSGSDIIAMFATIQTIFSEQCTSMSGPTLDAQKKIIVITCSNPHTNTNTLLKSRAELFPSWSFVVNTHTVPNQGTFEKIDFFKVS